MSILLFGLFFVGYSVLFCGTRHNAAPVVAPAPVLTAPVRTVAKTATPAPTLVIKEAVKQPALVEAPVVEDAGDDVKPIKIRELRKWATRHGIKGAGKMNTATLKAAIEAAGL